MLVTFLHLVVGEMAPKSWAIAHPETSAIMLALPMRAFMTLTRPALLALNGAANWCLRRIGVEPADQVAAGQGPDDLRHLVEHSASVGALDVAYSDQLSGALDLRRLTVEDLLAGHAAPSAVGPGATAAHVQEASRASGHLRILVQDGQGRPEGVVHVRDTLLLPDDAPVADVARPVFVLGADVPLHTALTRMRETGNHLAVVPRSDADGPDGPGADFGVVTLADVLRRILPRTAAARPA
nr:hypothetical protein GCM10025730_46540 [Promicromonospora thailandica]